ncbi:MAG: formate dehydrogenase accessory protein FdhE [Chloroflexi bacterium]|nr:formate dehydrogenase accessory protein FdhE [Chloroflexota bacterium]
MTADLRSDPATDPLAIERLDRLAGRLRSARPWHAPAIDLHARLLRETLAAARAPRADALPRDSQRVAETLAAGVPLLHQEPVHVDVVYAGDLFGRLVNALAGLESAPQGVDAVIAAATSGLIDPHTLFREAFVQHFDHLAEMAIVAGADPDLLTVLARLAVSPLLRAYADMLAPIVGAAIAGTDGSRWRRGFCLVCGAWPALGELRGLELQRHLRCGACGTSWPALRLECVFCGTEDFRQLRALQAEDERRLRVEVCDRCHRYLKVLNAFDPTPSYLVALEDVASAHLDAAAVERGFSRPDGTGFRLEIDSAAAEPSL